MMKLKNSYTTFALFILLSLISVVTSGAPLKVHAVDISALFIAFVVPGLIALNKENIKQLYVWIFGAVVGLLYWDILSAYVIVKREIFMGWYVVYPLGVIVLLSLQLLAKHINSKLPYNKSFKMDVAKRRGAI